MTIHTDVVLQFGGAVKALDEAGRVGGWLVEFADPATRTGSPDIAREFFTSHTDYDIEPGTIKACTISRSRPQRHAQEPKDRAGQDGDQKDAAVWMEAELELRDEYEKNIFAMIAAEAGLVQRKPAAPRYLQGRGRLLRDHVLASGRRWFFDSDSGTVHQPSCCRDDSPTSRSLKTVIPRSPGHSLMATLFRNLEVAGFTKICSLEITGGHMHRYSRSFGKLAGPHAGGRLHQVSGQTRRKDQAGGSRRDSPTDALAQAAGRSSASASEFRPHSYWRLGDWRDRDGYCHWLAQTKSTTTTTTFQRARKARPHQFF